MESYNGDRTISVLIAEDHDRVRAAVRAILELADGIEVVGEAAHGTEAIRLAEQTRPDVLLLDLDLEVISGEIVVGAAMKKLPQTQVLILTSYDDTEYAKGFLDGGAAGCVLKEDVPASLVEAVRTVLEQPDATYISPHLTA